MIKYCLMIAALLGLMTSDLAADPESDRKEVESTVKAAVEKVLVALKNGKIDSQQRRAHVIKVIDPLVDFQLMAKLTLGKTQWSSLDAEQREKFTDLFVKTMHSLYFEKLELFSDEVVEYEQPVANDSKYHMMTYVISKGERIKVAYKLYKKDEGWLVYDLELEGVSIVRSYSNQYRDFLRDRTFADLLVRMQEKLDGPRPETGKKKLPESTQ